MKLFFLLSFFLGSGPSSSSFAFVVPRSSSSSTHRNTRLHFDSDHDQPATGASAATSSSDVKKNEPKVCVITGSSQGLGLAMALELAKHGQKVVINHFPGLEEDAEKAVEQVNQAGGEGFAVPADCTNSEQIDEMFHKIVDRFGRVDVLVNNAGITKDNLVLRMKPQEWEAVINVNLSGDFYVTQGFLKHAIRNSAEEGARIINIASVVGQIGNAGQANYAASKGGVIGFTKSLAKELAPDNIKVNAVCPGFIETPMTAKLTEEQVEKSLSSIPLHRFGKPSEVAAMVRFLAIDEGAEYMTGHCFDVDGGVGIASA